MSRNIIPSKLRLGFLGAGQLARMSAVEAFKLGIQVSVFSDREENEPVQFMTPFSTTGSYASVDDMVAFAKECDVVTLENEFIGSDILKEVQDKSGTPIFPSPETFAKIENKHIEKIAFQDAGIPVTPFIKITDPYQLFQFGNTHGWPYLLKSSKGGYDGYGNKTVHDIGEARKAWEDMGGPDGEEIITEAFVNFTHELAVQVVRNETGTVVYPVCETVQQNHICVAVLSPAPIQQEKMEKVQELAIKATEAIDGKGIFAYEFFLTTKGKVLLNESAPRPHNSGHYTIEGCVTSQFENHVRAVLGMPLGSPELRKPAAAMINLLGTQNRDAAVEEYIQSLQEADGHLHMYGKLQSKVGRKMGHYTLLGDDLQETYHKARELTDNIEI